jgi:hypothetical protein
MKSDCKEIQFKSLIKKTKVRAFAAAEPVIAKVIANGKTLEQVSSYLGCEMSYRNNRDMEEKLTGSVSFVAL